MIAGALILLLGIVIGHAECTFYLRKKKTVEDDEKPYSKYKNLDGLLSVKQVRESKRAKR